MEEHIDFCRISYYTMELNLLKRIPADSETHNGDYVHYSEPHTLEDCPFKESNKVPIMMVGSAAPLSENPSDPQDT